MVNLIVGSIRNLNPIIGYTDIYVDRRSALGNPFLMKKDQRINCCNAYDEYLLAIINNNNFDIVDIANRYKCIIDYYRLNKNKYNKKDALKMFNNILTLLKYGKNVRLLCWCNPKKCHADSIAKYLIKNL